MGKEIAEKKIFIKSILKGGRIYEEILMQSGHENVISSCYDCLRDYYNQQYHKLLNWRIALDIAYLTNDKM